MRSARMKPSAGKIAAIMLLWLITGTALCFFWITFFNSCDISAIICSGPVVFFMLIFSSNEIALLLPLLYQIFFATTIINNPKNKTLSKLMAFHYGGALFSIILLNNFGSYRIYILSFCEFISAISLTLFVFWLLKRVICSHQKCEQIPGYYNPETDEQFK